MILVDTCVLTRLADIDSADRPTARRCRIHLRKAGENLAIVPQIICEFWAVASRGPGHPTKDGENGLGLTTDSINQWIAWYKRVCTFLPESVEVPKVWEKLATQHKPKGLAVYDLRLVAFMQIYNITQLLTFNTRHFKKYPITLLDPKTLTV